DALNRNADGIWIDNNYLHPCRCKLCVSAFREFLAENRNDLLEPLYLSDFSKVEIPPSLDSGYLNDPIVQAFMEFNCDRNVKIHDELKNHMESINSDAVFASNPALYRGNSYAARGVDFYKMLKVNDLIYLENKFFPEEKDGQVSGNYHGFVMGDALGTPAIPGAWEKADFDSTSGRRTSGLPETVSEIERAMLEGVVFGNATGAFWAVRGVPQTKCENAEDQLKMYYEIPEICQSMRETLKYIQSLPVFGARRNIAEIAVLHHRDSMSLDFAVHHAASHGIEEILLSAGMPFNALHSADLSDKITEFRLIVLPGIRVLRNSEIEILTNYVNSGGRLLILGNDCGLFDENRSARLDTPLKKISGVGYFDKFDSPQFNTYGEGETALIPNDEVNETRFVNLMSSDPDADAAPGWFGEPSRITDAILKLLGGDSQLILTSSSKVAATISEIGEDRMVVQLFSYADDLKPETLELKLALGIPSSNATIYQIGRKPLDVYCEDGKSIVITAFKRHAALVFKSGQTK
ncbi:MAG: hypothetical protein KAG97_11655, partial [Victivallales bacterium]|nr:hypothetical protein [Victivallales bacterium]